MNLTARAGLATQRSIRRPRLVTRTFQIQSADPSRPLGTGAVEIVGTMMLVLGAGVGLLMLPVSAEAGHAGFSDAFFTAVSALCVTGLVTVETQAHWSFFGEAVILLLVQVGGLGYMLGVTLTLWVLGRRVGLRDRHLLRQYYGAPSIGEALQFAKRVAYFALIGEAIGVVVLYFAFWAAGVSATTSIWWAVFHSVSAFNNSGFSLTGADMVPFQRDPAVLLSIAALVFAGSIGALPFLSIVSLRSLRDLPLDHTLILLTTGALILFGAAFNLVLEWQNEATLGAVDPVHRPTVAIFQSVVTRTAGYSAFDISQVHDETQFLTVGLMFIGGAAGSTAGGIKVGVFALLFFALIATLRGQDEVVAVGRRVPMFVIRQALTMALLGVAALFATATLLATVSGAPFAHILFESASALGTVGLTTGTTLEFGELGRAILIAAMIVGRFGPLVLVLAMTRQRRRRRTVYILPEDSIRLG